MYNRISTIGAVITVITALVIMFLLLINLMSDETINPYLGIILFMVLPGMLFLGLVLIPLGIYREWRSRQRSGEMASFTWPSLDLNNHRHRNATLLFIIGSLLLLFIGSVGMYQAYNFTETVAFCGRLCHTLMKPEYTAYQDSPHARVKCVECHIGPGAEWYVRSKLTGAYEVYATIVNNFPRPIPTPIKNLRPAQETCEHCHWPRQFFGAIQRQFDHYFYDKKNTHWPINMLIKIGGGTLHTPQAEGIHWHMIIANEVQYIARDARRQDIPWVRVKNRETGKITVYQDMDKPLSEQEIAAVKPRTMDCMDCHSRPSHNFHSPDYVIDLAIAAGKISPSLPEIKLAAVNSMIKEYPSEQESMTGIADSITAFYQQKYPRLLEQKKNTITQAIQATQGGYSRNIFPVMKVKWSDYPDNIGHFIFAGCMRCHNGKHKSDTGKVVTNNCRACHVILSQGTAKLSAPAEVLSGLDFKHPVDIGDAWKKGCFNCHTGVQP